MDFQANSNLCFSIYSYPCLPLLDLLYYHLRMALPCYICPYLLPLLDLLYLPGLFLLYLPLLDLLYYHLRMALLSKGMKMPAFKSQRLPVYSSYLVSLLIEKLSSPSFVSSLPHSLSLPVEHLRSLKQTTLGKAPGKEPTSGGAYKEPTLPREAHTREFIFSPCPLEY